MTNYLDLEKNHVHVQFQPSLHYCFYPDWIFLSSRSSSPRCARSSVEQEVRVSSMCVVLPLWCWGSLELWCQMTFPGLAPCLFMKELAFPLQTPLKVSVN